MKLIKIYIKNFKGVESDKTIELKEDGLTLFDGPNGYGKTTIFDVIELCLRGSLYKTTVNKEVTADRADYSKAFYQNNIEEDVIIKTHFKNSSGDDLVIIKHLPKDSPGKSKPGRKFKPDDFDILHTYRGDLNNFKSSEINKEKDKPLSQEKINRFFFSDNTKISIENTFLLFNYLQQEENIYFLKKSENDKRSELDFLFQTENESNTLIRIKRFTGKLKKACEGLNARIKSLDLSNVKFEEVNFKQVIKGKEFKFDSDEPFDGIDVDELEIVCRQYLTDIEELRKFIENFEPTEFIKLKNKQTLNKYKENKYGQLAFILESFIDEESFQEIKELNLKNKKYLKFLESESKESDADELLDDFDFNNEQIEKYKQLIEDLNGLKEEAGTLVNLISELNDLRKRTF
ncbi:MAG: AAA family ATPase, partial [Candidatus Paceibacterota bacterium]